MSHRVRAVVARAKGEPVTIETIEVPDPGPGEVLVAVQACGVCHTDLHYREGAINDDFPFLLGHEAAGVVEEVGAANFFCVKDDVISTPELTGTILPGVTRESVIEIARDLGYEVREEKVDVDYALSADECFCAGTAAVISSIGSIKHGDRVASFGDGEVGPITRILYDELTGIQQKRIPNERGWTVAVE